MGGEPKTCKSYRLLDVHRKQKTVTQMIKTRVLSSEVEIEVQHGRLADTWHKVEA